MGRHSAPDDTDEDVDLAERAVDPPANVAVATEPAGRHTGAGRPRPGPEAGLDLIDDALDDGLADDEPIDDEPVDDGPAASTVPGPVAEPLPGPLVVVDAETAEAAVLEPIDEALTTEIPLAEIARHDRPLPEETTARIAPVTDDPTGPPRPDSGAEPAVNATPTPTPTRGGAHATRHDLALVMAHGDVRARAVAAVLVPFVVYVAVLAVIGRLTVHNLIWVWAPAVVAGVLVGVVLDAGHRRYPGPAVGRPTPVSGPADPA